jgi:hypothetical protein
MVFARRIQRGLVLSRSNLRQSARAGMEATTGEHIQYSKLYVLAIQETKI